VKPADVRFDGWFDALEKRHLADLTFQEVRRSVQALSAIYVEQRDRIDTGAALNGAGKRAAFAMFFAPLHFLLVREIVRALGAAKTMPGTILDLGCGTGIAGAAWALECDPSRKIIGIDRNTWTLQEAKWTYHALGLRGITKSADIRTLPIPPQTAVVAAFTLNELDPETRDRFLARFLKMDAPVLIVEPIARRLAGWWDEWADAFVKAGGRSDSWRFRVDLPEKLKLMDKAAGLDHRELTGRSLWKN
jgi:SAM-dependent methyltransferase